MQSLICQQCHASLSWDGQSEIVRCAYCGTQYRMHPRRSGGSGVRVGTGAVSEIQTTQGRYAGHALVRSYIPKDWTIETNAPEQQANLLCPLTIQVAYASPAQDAFVTFTGTRDYNHLEQTPQNAQMQGQMIQPDRMIGLAFRDAGAVCDGVLSGNPSLSDVRLLSAMDTPDAWAREHQQKMLREYAQAGTMNPGGTWAKKSVTVRDANGQLWHKQVEAMVNYAYLPVPPQEQMMYQMLMQNRARTMGMSGMLGGMRGMLGGLMAGMAQPQIQPPQPKLRWTIQYVVETTAREGAFTAAMDAHEKIRNSIEVLPLFEREAAKIRDMLAMQAQQEQAVINDALGQMNRDRMASWDRQQQIIQSTSDYGSSIMREMRESNAQTQQRVNNLRSESIRGVNTYYTQNPGFGVPPVVEAGTQWDHVYQNTQNPDVFAASTGAVPLEFGVDYEELKQTGGDY